MAYNFDSVPSRRHPSILNKWTWYSKNVLPLWVADADFPVAPQIQKALHQQVEHGVLGYELPNKALNDLIVARTKKLYDWDVNPDWIVYTAGVSNGYSIAIRGLCSSKKGYLIQPPVYNHFHETEHATGVRKQEARLEEMVSGNRISYEVDFETLERGGKSPRYFCYVIRIILLEKSFHALT